MAGEPRPKASHARPSVAKGKGARAKATRLHSLIIRSAGVCANPDCDYRCPCPQFPMHGRLCRLECAHIVPRGRAWTRTSLDNAVCLCSKCHHRFGVWPDEWMRFLDESIGRDRYDELKLTANMGVGRKFDWDAELERLVVEGERIGVRL